MSRVLITMTENEELKTCLKKYGITKPNGDVDYVKVSEITGLTHGSVKTTLQPNNEAIPRWLRLLIHIEKIKDEEAV